MGISACTGHMGYGGGCRRLVPRWQHLAAPAYWQIQSEARDAHGDPEARARCMVIQFRTLDIRPAITNTDHCASRCSTSALGLGVRPTLTGTCGAAVEKVFHFLDGPAA